MSSLVIAANISGLDSQDSYIGLFIFFSVSQILD